MLVSVVIPVYGRKRTLGAAVASAASQTGVPRDQIEIIIVDDASPVSVAPPDGIANLKVVRLSRNAGPAGARNAGIEASHGEFIAFLDSDDIWRPDKLRHQLQLAEELRQSCDLSIIAISCAFYVPNRFDCSVELRIPRPASQLSEFVGGCWMCPGSTLLVHRSVYDRAGMLDVALRRLEDYEWFLRFASHGGRLVVSHHAGAVIAPSGGPKLQPVREAIHKIRQNTKQGSRLRLPFLERQIHESYLELELTAASLGERRNLRAAYHLFRSFLAKPRFTASTSEFWQRSKDVPDDVVLAYRRMIDAAQSQD